jgi:hypothetical protein
LRLMVEIAAADALWGRVSPEPEMAVEFLRAWHGGVGGGGERAGKGLVTVVPLDARGGHAGRTAFGDLGGVCGALALQGLDDMIWQRDKAGDVSRGPFNLYTNVGELSREPDRSRNPFARGTKRDMGWVPGAWIDLDCGPGRFADLGDCQRGVDAVGLEPTITVETGSGGMHCYWRLGSGLDPANAEEMSKRLIEQFRAVCGVKVDSVGNSDRIMRLPGSVRWPKKGEGGADGSATGGKLCRLARIGGPVWSVGDVVALTADVWAGVEARHASAVLAERRLMAEAGGELREAARRGGSGSWMELYSVACAEETFAREVSWEAVLEPSGWRLLGGDGEPDREGRRTWTRPGGGGSANPRSLITDWSGSPDVASLLSEAEETGLLRLKMAGVALTKMRVWVELAWGGDLVGFLRSWIAGGRVSDE